LVTDREWDLHFAGHPCFWSSPRHEAIFLVTSVNWLRKISWCWYARWWELKFDDCPVWFKHLFCWLWFCICVTSASLYRDMIVDNNGSMKFVFGTLEPGSCQRNLKNYLASLLKRRKRDWRLENCGRWLKRIAAPWIPLVGKSQAYNLMIWSISPLHSLLILYVSVKFSKQKF